MQAIVITSPGPPDVLQLQTASDPVAQEGQVIIAVAATALNRADLLQRKGQYPPPTGSPPYPGLEVAGRIVAVGVGVTRYQGGERVMALLGGGGYAEQVAVSASVVIPIPANLGWREAAAIPEAWLTAYSNMLEIGRLQADESVLIHAGGSGVGTAAIQLAKWRGATVFTTASAGKLDFLRTLGADITIDYRTTNFADTVLDITDGRGVDVILDFLGAPYWNDNLRALALWGRLVLVGLMGGRTVEANLGLFLSKKLTVAGSTLRDRTEAQKAALVANFEREILPALADGTLRPVLDGRTFALAEAAAAHTYMESNQNVGKIVLDVNLDLL